MEPQGQARAVSRRALMAGAGVGAAMMAVAACSSGSEGDTQFTPEQYGAKADGVTDDTSAIQQAINAAFDHANSSGTFYAVVVFQPRTYKVAGSYRQTGSGNAQLYLPIQPQEKNKVTLALVGARNASALPMWNTTASPPKAGTVLLSTGAGSGNGVNGTFCVLGGPNSSHGYGATTNRWNNMLIHIDGISVVVPSPAAFSGIDLRCVAQANIGTASVFANAHPQGLREETATGAFQVPTVSAAVGLMMPETNNNDNSWIGNFSCEGMYSGLYLGEHSVVENCRFVYCVEAIVVTSSGHVCLLKAASIEWCHYGINYNGSNHADFLFLDYEPGSSPWSLVAYIYNTDPVGSLGTVRIYQNDRARLLGTYASVVPSDAKNVRVFDCRLAAGYRTDGPAPAASGTDLRNPFYRDAQVIVSGGTVRDIEIDGQSTGLTTGAFMLPTCKTINITYSVAPTLRWWLTSATM